MKQKINWNEIAFGLIIFDIFLFLLAFRISFLMVWDGEFFLVILRSCGLLVATLSLFFLLKLFLKIKLASIGVPLVIIVIYLFTCFAIIQERKIKEGYDIVAKEKAKSEELRKMAKVIANG